MRKIKRIAILALVLVAALLLSGCMKMHINVVWNEDNSATITMTYGIQKSAIEMMGASEDEVRDSLREDMVPDDASITFRDYSDAEYVGVTGTIEIADITKDSVDSLDTLRFRSEENGKKTTYTVSGRFNGSDMAGDEDSLDSAGISLDSIDMQITIEMPGKVTSHNATEAKGNVLTWVLDPTGTTSIQAESEAGGGSMLLWIILIALIVILLGIAGTILVLMKKKKAEGQPPAATQAAYGGAPAYQAPDAYQQAPQAYGSPEPPPAYAQPVAPQAPPPPAYAPPEPPQQAPQYAPPPVYTPPEAPQAPSPYYAPPPAPDAQYQPQASPRCAQCGAELPQGSRFCPVCGAAN